MKLNFDLTIFKTLQRDPTYDHPNNTSHDRRKKSSKD